MNPLLELHDHGQSFWLDNLTRGMLRNGGLERRVAEGLSGVTSNPSTFRKAIVDSEDYDEEIAALIAEGHSVENIYQALVTSDVRQACDVLRPVYERTRGGDGYGGLASLGTRSRGIHQRRAATSMRDEVKRYEH